MSHMSRLWVAAGVAVVKLPHGKKLKSGVKSLNHGKNFLSAVGDAADIRPQSGELNSERGGFLGEEKRKQAEDSLRQVMYLNCWGPS